MKYTVKALSLLLLMSSFAFAAQDAQIIDNDFDTEVTRSKDSDIQRTFEAILTFDQEVGSNGKWLGNTVARPHNVFGKIRICFSKDLTRLKVKLFVFNAEGNENPNERPVRAHFHAQKAGMNGSIVLNMFEPNPIPPCGQPTNGVFFEGTLTDADMVSNQTGVTPITFNGITYNTIAALYAGIRQGDIYANVHGGTNCQGATPGYPGGMIRAQIFADNVSN